VPALLANRHRPDGKITDVLASTLARTTAADTLVNYSLMYVPQRPVISHCPHGKLTIACCLQGGGVLVIGGTVSIVNSQIYSNTAGMVRAHLQKSPSPQWETHTFCSLFAYCLQGGGVFVWGGTVSIVNSQIYSNTVPNYVRADIRNFPSPPWETHVLLVVCRVAVSMLLAVPQVMLVE
jgi:hypothetical protein